MTGSVRTSYVAAGVIAQSLITANGKPVFGSIESVLDSISMDEIALLDDAVTNALSIVSPIVGLSEYGAWHTALCDGAKDPSNVWAAHAIGDAYILVDGPHINPRIIDRPEDYWGISRRELIDCHWLAYRAARAVKEQGLK